ncbi:hypothetical protein V8C42DRAFT_331485 [Trichoderma barbatum]
MAGRNASNLSGLQNSCDFVVATTQASINANLWEYLAEGTHPAAYVIFGQDEKGQPTLLTSTNSLEDLLKVTNGVNPFENMPDGMDYDDPRIDKINDSDFYIGIMLQMGVPPGCDPKSLPPIVTLIGDSPNKVTFNMYCSQITVIHDFLSARPRKVPSRWNVWNQPSGNPWAIQCNVDLVMENLDEHLSQIKDEKAREQLKNALNNLSGTAFSLQQLVFDLDNAALADNFGFTGVPPGDARDVLQKTFHDIYAKTAKENGWPVVAVTAVAQPKDESSLHMTSFERTVTPLKDSQGHPVSNSDAVTTLNYLCAVDNHPRPSRYTTFDWNWVQAQEAGQESGVIAINRNVLIQFIVKKLETLAQEFCYAGDISDDWELSLVAVTPPPFKISPDGTQVALLEQSEDRKKTIQLDGSPADFRIITRYKCQVEFGGKDNQIKISQTFEMLFDVYVDYHNGEFIDVGASPISSQYTNTYEVSVNQNGGLQLTMVEDIPKPGYSEVTVPDYKQLYTLAQHVKKMQDDFIGLHVGNLHALQISQLQSFVFPGAKVFTFKNPRFSDHQDLICEITYVDPSKVSPAQQHQPEPKTEPEPMNEPQSQQGDNTAPSIKAPPLPPIGTVGKLTATTELMQNYVQGEIVSPMGKFEALQSGDGHSLLFAIDSSGVFHVIEEQSGTSRTGWHVHDLSTTTIQAQFSGQTNAVVRTFGVGQSIIDGSIGLIMVVNVNDKDHLFISLGNSNNVTSWMANPTWTDVPFDSAEEQLQEITIVSTFFAETHNNAQYLVVDIKRPAEQSIDSHIARYHIDPARVSGRYWVKHDVTVDIASGQYQSAVGRIHGKPVDGIYTAGMVGKQPQLVYEPIINYYGEGPASPSRLQLPSGVEISAIATSRNTDGSTDLYTIGGYTLYYFPTDQQKDDAKPILLATDDLFFGTDTLRAMSHGGIVTLWGKNSSNQVYYLSCPISRLAETVAWSAPIVILSDAEHISPYVNCIDGGNMVFAAGGGRLQKLVQGSAATGRTWRAQEIVLEAPPMQKPVSFKSHTTVFHVAQMDKELPAPNTRVSLSTITRTPVYINGLYYVLSSTPIHVVTDATGSLTVVEVTDSIHGTILVASLDNDRLSINPMDQVFAKLAALNSSDKLRNAQCPSQTVAGGIIGSTQFASLVPSSVNDDDVKAVSQNLDLLKSAYSNSQGQGGVSDVQNPEEAAVPGVQGEVAGTVNLIPGAVEAVHQGVMSGTANLLSEASNKGIIPRTQNLNIFGDFFHDLGAFVGDLGKLLDSFKDILSSTFGDTFQWMKNAAKSFGRLVHDTVTNTLHFVAKIGEKIYHAALDTVHSLVSAAQWMFDKIKTGVEKLIEFVQTLFHWDDIRRTKDVMHNVMKLWLQHQVDYIPKAKESFDNGIKVVESKMNEWAGVTGWSALGDASQKPAASSAADPNKGHTSSSKLLANHYQNHASQLQILGNSPTLGMAEKLIKDLITAISNEGKVLGQVLDQLIKLASDFSSLSVEDILRRLIGILVDGVLSSVQVVVDALLTILYDVAQSAIAILDTKIHIPVISDILNLIGVPDVSFLDLVCWIAAAGVTTVYKIAKQRPPFPANDDVNAIISAGTWNELAELFGQPQSAQSQAFFQSSSSFSQASAKFISKPKLPKSLIVPFFEVCHGFSAFLCFIGNPVTSVEANSEAGESGIISKGATGIKIAVSVAQSAGDFFVPQDSILDPVVSKTSMVISGLGILSSIYFSSTAQDKMTSFGLGSVTVSDPRGIGAIVGAILIPVRLIITGWHFYELSKDGAGDTRTAAILGEVSNLASYASRISYAVAVNDEDPDSRLIAVTAKAACDDAYSGLQVAEAIAGYI